MQCHQKQGKDDLTLIEGVLLLSCSIVILLQWIIWKVNFVQKYCKTFVYYWMERSNFYLKERKKDPFQPSSNLHPPFLPPPLLPHGRPTPTLPQRRWQSLPPHLVKFLHLHGQPDLKYAGAACRPYIRRRHGLSCRLSPLHCPPIPHHQARRWQAVPLPTLVWPSPLLSLPPEVSFFAEVFRLYV